MHRSSSSRAFQRDQECDQKHSGLVDLISTKQNKTNKLTCFIDRLVWPLLLAQVGTHYKTGKLNMWTLFCNVCVNFLNSQIWKEIRFALNGKPSSVTTFSTDFSFQNLVFWNLFEFSHRNYLNINISHILNPNLTKQIPLNPAHQDLSNSTKGTFQYLRNIYSLKIGRIPKHSKFPSWY
jgi:hypothetical protein